MRKIKILSSLILFFGITQAQTDCNCKENLIILNNALKDNYAGYQYKTSGVNGIRLNTLFQQLLEKAEAKQYQNYNCARLLEAYITAFEDKHTHINYLGLRHFTKKLSDEAKDTLFDAISDKVAINIDSLLQSKKDSTNFSEGMYTNKEDTCVVLKRENLLHDYVGIIVTSNKKYWKKGEVMFELKQNQKKQYDYFFYDELHSLESRRDIRVSHTNIDNWVKISSAPTNLKAKEVPVRYKQLYCDSTLYLSLPTFTSSYKSIIDAFLQDKKTILQRTPNLILDLRGNVGGSDNTFENLIPYLYTTPIINKDVLLYCSANTIEKWKERANDEENSFLSKLVKRMRANKGKFIYLHTANEFTIKLDTICSYPKHIYVMVDRYCASSAEEFILIAKQSSKVTVLGENTSGCLDFSNVTSYVPAGDAGVTWWNLDYASTISQRLPETSVDEKGIAPDIYLRNDSNWIDQIYQLIADSYNK